MPSARRNRAVAEWTAIIALNPNDAHAFNGRGFARQREGDYDSRLNQ